MMNEIDLDSARMGEGTRKGGVQSCLALVADVANPLELVGRGGVEDLRLFQDVGNKLGCEVDDAFSEVILDTLDQLKPQDSADWLHVYDSFMKVWDRVEWRGTLVKKAYELTKEQGSFNLFITVLIELCTMVTHTEEAVKALEHEKVEVGRLDSNRFSALRVDETEYTKFIKALNRKAGVIDLSTDVRVALNLGLWYLSIGRLEERKWTEDEAKVERNRQKTQSQKATSVEQKVKVLQDLHGFARQFKLGAGADTPAGGGHFDLNCTENPVFTAAVEDAGRVVLRQLMSDHFEEVTNVVNQVTKHDVLYNNDFFFSNPNLCAAWVKDNRVLEIYKMSEPHQGYNYLELHGVLNGVSYLPKKWNGTHLQEFHCDKSGRLQAAKPEGKKDCEGYKDTPRRFMIKQKYPYVPVPLQSSKAQKQVEEYLIKEGLKGGCWKTIMYGRLPSTLQQSEERGYRKVPACVAVAGLAYWFETGGTGRKSAHWIEFDNVTLENKEPLVLGHCKVTSSRGGRSRPYGRQNYKKVTFIAAVDSAVWHKSIMWGLCE